MAFIERLSLIQHIVRVNTGYDHWWLSMMNDFEDTGFTWIIITIDSKNHNVVKMINLTSEMISENYEYKISQIPNRISLWFNFTLNMSKWL